jgi:hypothetical protein
VTHQLPQIFYSGIKLRMMKNIHIWDFHAILHKKPGFCFRL